MKAIFLLLAIGLSGCGFHLRGLVNVVPTWLTNVAIVSQQPHQSLAPLLKDQLEANHIRVNPDPSRAHYLLVIESETLSQQFSSVSSSTTPRQYQLIYTVLFQLQEASGKEIIPARPIVVTRQITSNSNRILGSNDEESQIKDEMRRDAVIQMLNRIQRGSVDGH
jgi:LPS-assembly lipoprotein